MKPYAESDKVGSLCCTICFSDQHIKINVVVTQAILDFCNMELFQGGNAVNKCMHSAFRIRTDIYVGLGLINCVLISLAFILLQSILFVGYSAVGLDGEIF